MVEACKTGRERVIYYSYCESEPLVECMYKVGKCYYAIQVTISDSHDCGGENDGKVIDDFFEKIDLKDDEELNLSYAVPDAVFLRFVTKPCEPKVPTDVAGTAYVLHAEIKRPCWCHLRKYDSPFWAGKRPILGYSISHQNYCQQIPTPNLEPSYVHDV